MTLRDIDLKYSGKALTTGRSLNLTSTFAGGENTFDSTSRINLFSSQRAQHLADDGTTYAHFGELLRLYSRKHNSKQMIAWYGPTSYDGNGDPATADTAWFWMGAHYDPNDPGPVHGHWSVESPDLNGDLQTRFEVRIWDPTSGAFGMNRTIAKFNAADVVVAQDNGALYMAASAGTNKNLYFTNDSTVVSDVSSTGKRWSLQANGTTEAGSNVGTDFQINRYNDSGVFTDAALFIKRSTGQVGIGNVISPAAKLDVSAAGSYHTVQSTQTTTSSVSFAAYSGILGLVTNKVFDGRVTGDAVGRLAIYGDGKHEWGDGTNNRDTNLYRGSADTLQTDDSFVVGGTLRAPTMQGSTVSGGTLTLRSTANATKGTINIGSSQWNDGTSVILLANTTSVPASNPTGGGYLYVDSGALKFRGSSGTVTTIAPA
ncbi:hypothetical protein ABZV15_08050 [Streptomyces sp. NPDC005246]|uniref:hypothetical protein n=1 Tax=Streptomyces sp. NPDC005246 TaxID=3156716 RepID=UPI0033AB7BF2